MKILAVIFLFGLLAGCGSEHERPDHLVEDISQPAPTQPEASQTTETEPVLFAIQGKINSQGETLEGEGFSVEVENENAFIIKFSTPFVEAPDYELKASRAGLALMIVVIEKDSIKLVLAQDLASQPAPYQLSFKIIGFRS